MNGLIKIKTCSPLHVFLNKFLGYQSIGIIVENKVYLLDEFGLYEHQFGVDFGVFKQYCLIESIQYKEIKNISWNNTGLSTSISQFWKQSCLESRNRLRGVRGGYLQYFTPAIYRR
jgi:hypothetical protein